MSFRLDLGALSLRYGHPAPPTVLLVRHGQSQTNIDKSLHAVIPDPDVELTAKGKLQAAGAGEFLQDWLSKHPKKPVRLYRSDYTRAIQTSDIIMDKLAPDIDLSVRTDDRVRELEFGYSDGFSNDEVGTTFPEYGKYSELWDGKTNIIADD